MRNRWNDVSPRFLHRTPKPHHQALNSTKKVTRHNLYTMDPVKGTEQCDSAHMIKTEVIDTKSVIVFVCDAEGDDAGLLSLLNLMCMQDLIGGVRVITQLSVKEYEAKTAERASLAALKLKMATPKYGVVTSNKIENYGSYSISDPKSKGVSSGTTLLKAAMSKNMKDGTTYRSLHLMLTCPDMDGAILQALQSTVRDFPDLRVHINAYTGKHNAGNGLDKVAEWTRERHQAKSASTTFIDTSRYRLVGDGDADVPHMSNPHVAYAREAARRGDDRASLSHTVLGRYVNEQRKLQTRDMFGPGIQFRKINPDGSRSYDSVNPVECKGPMRLASPLFETANDTPVNGALYDHTSHSRVTALVENLVKLQEKAWQNPDDLGPMTQYRDQLCAVAKELSTLPAISAAGGLKLKAKKARSFQPQYGGSPILDALVSDQLLAIAMYLLVLQPSRNQGGLLCYEGWSNMQIKRGRGGRLLSMDPGGERSEDGPFFFLKRGEKTPVKTMQLANEVSRLIYESAKST